VPFLVSDISGHQPETLNAHPTDMRVRTILFAAFFIGTSLVYTACNTKPQSPDQVREKTAEATAQLKDNAKAVAEGVREGLTRPSPDKPLDLNSASKSQLMGLPGIDDAAADRIIGGRPYSSEHELLERHIVAREEYNKIADSITVKK
jgi:DNA uptake protein ComE-like DNA-binding protein